MFIIIVFRLGLTVYSTVFPQGISHEMRLLAWGRVYDFSFSIVQVHFVFLLI